MLDQGNIHELERLSGIRFWFQWDGMLQIPIWIFSCPFESNLNLYNQQFAFIHVNICNLDTFSLLSEIERHIGVFDAQQKFNL